MGKEVLLLGSGAVGNVIARHLAASDHISALTVGDIRLERARAVAAGAGPKAEAARVDASDPAGLRSALARADMVVNAALPAYNLTIMESALAAGVHYLDLASGEGQLGLHRRWEEAGLTALLGVGEDPGISNVFARYAADALDEVHSIRVRDGETGTSGEFPFVSLFSPETFIAEALGPATVFEDGEFRTLPPMSGREEYPFPPPVGPVPVYYVDHEEVHTLPRFIGKGLRSVDFKLALLDEAAETLRTIARLGLMGEAPVEVGGSKVRPRDLLLALLPPPERLAGRISGSAIILVEVEGTRGGRRRKHVLWAALGHREAADRFGSTGTSYLTGTGAAVAVLQLASGAFRSPGVFPPECLDPRPFLRGIGERGIEVFEAVTEERSGIALGSPAEEGSPGRGPPGGSGNP